MNFFLEIFLGNWKLLGQHTVEFKIIIIYLLMLIGRIVYKHLINKLIN